MFLRHKQAICCAAALSGFGFTCAAYWLLLFIPYQWKNVALTPSLSTPKNVDDCLAEDWLKELPPGSSPTLQTTTNTFSIAFLIFNHKSSVNSSVAAFIHNVCSALFAENYHEPRTKVTFFVFNLQPFEDVDSCGKVHSISLNNALLKNSQDPNRCHLFLEYSHLYGFLESRNFNYVMLFDSLVNFPAKINFGRLLSEVLITFSYKSLINKWGRWSKGAVLYSSKAFGGRPETIARLCRNLAPKKSLHFQQTFDDYLKTHPPKRSIFLGMQECQALRQIYGTSFAFTDKITIPVKDSEEVEYLKYLEVVRESEEALNRQRKAMAIRDEIKHNFFATVRNNLTRKAAPHFVTASCKFPKPICLDNFFQPIPPREDGVIPCYAPFYACNGLGDRLRGTVTALYLAIATQRALHIDWGRPANLADYFKINEMFYDIETNLYNTILPSGAQNLARWIFQRGDVPEQVAFEEMVQDNFSELTGNFSDVKIMTNRFAGLEGILRNPSFQKIIRKTVPSAFGKYPIITNYLPLISGALRAILEKPQQKMVTLFEQIIQETIGHEFWQRSVKIGVQIRTEIVETNMGNRVVPDQIRCFIDELERLITLKIQNSYPVTIFVTADWHGAFPAFANSSLSQLQQVKMFYAGSKFNLTLNHMDKARLKGSDDELWWKAAKGFVDWYFLTKMDFLVISRSGFGESASLMSLKPTRRFKHWLSKGSECFFDDYYEELTTLRTASNVDIYDVL